MDGYPTKEYILTHPVTHKLEVIKLVKNWKTTWDYKTNTEAALRDLHGQLCKLYNKYSYLHFKQPKTIFIPTTRRIHLTNTSIISLLHEFCHSIYGASEEMACTWSIHLFLKTFPERTKHLVWKDHLLIYKS